MSSGLYAMRNTKNILNSNHLKSVYYTLIHPYINYGNLIWGSANKTFTNSILTLQNKAVRIMTSSKYNAHSKPLYTATKIMTLSDIHKSQLATMMYLHKNKTLPKPIQNLFKPNTDTHNYNTRHNQDPHIERRRTHQSTKSFLHQAPDTWYNLPQDIKDVRSLNSFKNKLKKFINQN